MVLNLRPGDILAREGHTLPATRLEITRLQEFRGSLVGLWVRPAELVGQESYDRLWWLHRLGYTRLYRADGSMWLITDICDRRYEDIQAIPLV